MKLKFQLQLDSDYHVGAGYGLGSQADSALLRDGDNVPALRGSTVVGLLRDGMWHLLQTPPLAGKYFATHREAEQNRRNAGGNAASAYCSDPSRCPLCRVFGTPASPKSWQVSSARPAGMAVSLNNRERWKVAQTGAQVVSRVRVSPRTRRVEARKLFNQEEGDGRLAFEFTATCDAEDESAGDEAALLVAVSRMVRRFGSARRRGRGECQIHLIKDDGTADQTGEQEWLNRFKQHWLNGQPSAPSKPKDREWHRPLTTGGSPVRYRVIVRTDEPVVIARRAEAGNIFDCLKYINGSTLWGALASAAADQWRLRKRDEDFYRTCLAYQGFRELLLRGLVRVSPLYPAHLDNWTTIYPTAPAPLDLLTCKVYPGFPTGSEDAYHHGARGYAGQGDPPGDCPQCKDNKHPDIPLAPVDGFLPVMPMAGGDQDYNPRQRDELHPRINPYTQRVAEGDLFGYVALESGQYFMGQIWCRDDGAWQALGELTGNLKEKEPLSLRLGKATRRGYGLVKVWLEKIENDGGGIWQGNPLEERVASLQSPLTLTLLTDAVLLDAWGRFRQTLDAPLLKEILGEPVEVIRAFCKSGYGDNFNNQLGLPRWRDIIIRAGSTVGFRLTQPTDLASLQANLKRVEEEGIGLRRNEGFGQAVFNHPVYQRNASVSGAGITVPDALRLAGRPTMSKAAEVDQESEFIDDWGRELRRKFSVEQFREEKWDAVARWLWTSAGQPIEALKSSLEGFGEASLLTDVKRDKKKSFTDNKAKEAMNDLKEFLGQAASKPGAFQRVAVQMLADRIAASVQREER